jgi:hypothetical protein
MNTLLRMKIKSSWRWAYLAVLLFLILQIGIYYWISKSFS